ncbi:sensor histidine kinase [Leifsonia poae]|uniref:sensor histidine kinase n=1 Tax=Leifsonia poae TaxID=110933 RepID=UPI003D672E68
MTAAQLFARLGARNPISVWSWVVTAPFAVTFMSGLQYVVAGQPDWAWLAISCLVHLGVGVLLALGWGVLALTPQRWRAGLAVVVFAVVGIARPFLFFVAAELLGVRIDTVNIPGRVAINVVVCITVFTLVALSVGLIREHRGVFQRLGAVQRVARADGDAVRRRTEELRDSRKAMVLDSIEAEVRKAATPGIDATAASALLRSLANDVVRPLSHELFEAEEGVENGSAATPATSSRGREWFGSVLGGMVPAPALFTALLFAMLVAPYAIGNYGFAVAGVQAVVGFLLAWGGNAIVTWWAARASGAAMRVGVLVGGYAVVGGLLVAESSAMLGMLGLNQEFVWFQACLYPVIALAGALVASLTDRLRADQRELEVSMRASVEATARMRVAYDRERIRLAHLLHSTVQAELIAQALALRTDATGDASEVVREALERIRTQLAESTSRPDPRARLERVVETWRSAMALDAHIDDAVWASLADDARSEAVIDTISEGLANAVRHGDGSPVSLAISPEGDGVRVVVTSGGKVAAARPGIGLRDLARAADVLLTERAGGVELAVSIP